MLAVHSSRPQLCIENQTCTTGNGMSTALLSLGMTIEMKLSITAIQIYKAKLWHIITAIQWELGNFIPGLDLSDQIACISALDPDFLDAQWKNSGTSKNYSSHPEMDVYICCHESLLGIAYFSSSFSTQGVKVDGKVGYIYPGDVRRQVRWVSSLKTVEGQQEPGWDWKEKEDVGHN